MAQGYDRRDVIPAGGVQALKAVGVPQTPVMRPVPSSVSAAGDGLDTLAKTLGLVSGALAKFGEQADKEAELAGQLAYAEGKSEADVVASGNKQTTAGFMAMKAKMAGNEWYTAKLLDIEQSDKKLSSQEYQAKMMADFQELMNNTAGADPYTRKLMGAMASDYMPRLVGEHVKSNAAWKQDETASSVTNLMLSDALTPNPSDPSGSKKIQSIQDVMSFAFQNLPKERAVKSISEALVMGLHADDPTILNAISADHSSQLSTQEQAANVPPGLLGYSLMKESGGRRFDAQGNLLQGPVTKSGERAQGERQVMPATMKDPGFGVLAAQNDSPDEIARVGKDYLTAMQSRYGGDGTLALMAYNSGPGNVDAHIAKVGDPRTGAISMQDFVKSYPAEETRKYVAEWMSSRSQFGVPQTVPQQNQKAGAMMAMVQAGFDASSITASMNAIDAFHARQGAKFDAHRETTEDAMLAEVAKDGNLPKFFEQVQTFKETNHLPDTWANGMASRGRTEYEKYAKAQAEMFQINSAIATNTLHTLPGDKQEKAIDIATARIGQEVAADKSVKQEDRPMVTFKRKVDMLRKNAIIDKRLANALQGQLIGATLGKDGTVSAETMGAYQQLRAIAETAGGQEAAKYVGDGEAGKLYETALLLDEGGAGTDAAVKQAIITRSRPTSGAGAMPQPRLDNETFHALLNDRLEKFFPSMWKNLTDPAQFVGGLESRDSEESRAINNAQLQATVKSLALAKMDADPNLPAQVAVDMVIKHTLGAKVEIVNGNVLFATNGSSIYKDMGLSDQEQGLAQSIPNATSLATMDYLRKNGEKLFGGVNPATGKFEPNPDFNSFKILGRAEDPNAGFWTKAGAAVVGAPEQVAVSIADKWRGFPKFDAQWVGEGQQRGMMIRLFTNASGTRASDQVRFIPASALGKIIRENILTPKQDSHKNAFDYLRAGVTQYTKAVESVFGNQPKQ